MEIDAKLRREITKRFEMESHKQEVEITENWKHELELIYQRKHEGINSLLIDMKGLIDRMNNRVKTVTAIIKEG
jgi:hypothetical protein